MLVLELPISIFRSLERFVRFVFALFGGFLEIIDE